MKNLLSFWTMSFFVIVIAVISCNQKPSNTEKDSVRTKNVIAILSSVLDYQERQNSFCIFSDTLFYTSENMIPQKIVTETNKTVHIVAHNKLPVHPIHSIIDTCIITDSVAVMVIFRPSCGLLMKSKLRLEQEKWTVISMQESDI